MSGAVIDKLLASVVVDSNVQNITVQDLIDALEEEEEAIRLYHANKDKKNKEALAAEAEKARLAVEKAEQDRLAAEAAEAARLAKLAEEAEMMKKAVSEGSVAGHIAKVGKGDGDGWIL